MFFKGQSLELAGSQKAMLVCLEGFLADFMST